MPVVILSDAANIAEPLCPPVVHNSPSLRPNGVFTQPPENILSRLSDRANLWPIIRQAFGPTAWSTNNQIKSENASNASSYISDAANIAEPLFPLVVHNSPSLRPNGVFTQPPENILSRLSDRAHLWPTIRHGFGPTACASNTLTGV